ncbi:hypothetical protein VTI28DRAFT_8774 [Corynascus sepedonium]
MKLATALHILAFLDIAVSLFLPREQSSGPLRLIRHSPITSHLKSFISQDSSPSDPPTVAYNASWVGAVFLAETAGYQAVSCSPQISTVRLPIDADSDMLHATLGWVSAGTKTSWNTPAAGWAWPREEWQIREEMLTGGEKYVGRFEWYPNRSAYGTASLTTNPGTISGFQERQGNRVLGWQTVCG